MGDRAAGDSYHIVPVRENLEAQSQLRHPARDFVRVDVRTAKHKQRLTKFEQELVQRTDFNRLNQVVQELG